MFGQLENTVTMLRNKRTQSVLWNGLIIIISIISGQ